MKEQTLFRQSAPFVEVIITLKKCFKRIRPEKERAHTAGYSENRRTEQTPWKCLRCEPQDKLIVKCTKPPIENEKRTIQGFFNEKDNHACNKGKKNSDQKIYA